jgi:hypothetical protein
LWAKKDDGGWQALSDAGGIDAPVVTYSPKLARFIAVADCDGGKKRCVLDAPHPWGPWTSLGFAGRAQAGFTENERVGNRTETSKD